MIDVPTMEDQLQFSSYKRFPFVIESGQGSYVYTDRGQKFLDCYGGHAVASTGHCHPKLVASIKEQADQLLFYSNLVHLKSRALASSRLVAAAPTGLNKVFFVNSLFKAFCLVESDINNNLFI